MKEQAQESGFADSINLGDFYIPVTVKITHVGIGGNAGSGAYQYTCHPEVVHVTQSRTIIGYQLSPDSPAELGFTGLYSSDSLYRPQLLQIGPTGGRYIQVMHLNQEAFLINVALQIQDTQKLVMLSVDPQVTNEPNPA
jgi:hypothetical protein